jgi:hypothetical protein
MAKESLDILLTRLYGSNDPDCYEAAHLIEKLHRRIDLQENKISDISLAAKYMLEGLIEITHLANERDKPRNIDAKKLNRELSLRLRECGEIAKDTANLNSVKIAYNRMYNE